MLTDPAGLRVHIDVKAAMTGVSRFGHLRQGDWVYDKTEGLSTDERAKYDVLLTEDATPFEASHRIVHAASVVDGFDTSALRLRFKPDIYVLVRNELPHAQQRAAI